MMIINDGDDDGDGDPYNNGEASLVSPSHSPLLPSPKSMARNDDVDDTNAPHANHIIPPSGAY
jgi:hypothetical protein